VAATVKPAMSMAEFAADITDLGDTLPSNNIMLYGDAGSGKTALASGLPDSILFGFDPGWMTAKKLKRKCRLRQITTYEALMAGIAWLEDGAWESYRWIIADGGNMIFTRILQQFTREAWEANPEKRVSAYQPDKPDYFKAQNVFKSAVARLCDLPTNVIFTFHAQHGDDMEGETWIRPHIEGRGYAVGNFVTGLVNSIGYMAPASVREGGESRQVRRILWQQYRNEEKGITYLAKDQLNIFPMTTDDLTPEQLDEMAMSDGAEPAPEPAPKTRRTRRQ
jgi:hypothetical protein